MSSLVWENRVISTPDTCHGKPRINGTRITVSSILDNLAEGHSIEEISKDLEIEIEDIMACLSYASYTLDLRELIG